MVAKIQSIGLVLFVMAVQLVDNVSIQKALQSGMNFGRNRRSVCVLGLQEPRCVGIVGIYVCWVCRSLGVLDLQSLGVLDLQSLGVLGLQESRCVGIAAV